MVLQKGESIIHANLGFREHRPTDVGHVTDTPAVGRHFFDGRTWKGNSRFGNRRATDDNAGRTATDLQPNVDALFLRLKNSELLPLCAECGELRINLIPAWLDIRREGSLVIGNKKRL